MNYLLLIYSSEKQESSCRAMPSAPIMQEVKEFYSIPSCSPASSGGRFA